MDNIISMAEKTDDATRCSPVQALQEAEKDFTDGVLSHVKKVLILSVDDTDGQFKINFIQSGMKMSQCLAACEVAKAVFLKEMGYIDD